MYRAADKNIPPIHNKICTVKDREGEPFLHARQKNRNLLEGLVSLRKGDIYQKELHKLTKIFEIVDEDKRKLVEGLIEDAAFLKAENYMLREVLAETGMIRIHPKNPNLQKATETGKQYLKNLNTYSVVIKTLNSILNKGAIEDDDDLDEFI